MKVKVKSVAIRIILLILCGLLYSAIAYSLGVFLSHKFGYSIDNVLTYEGIILTLIGIFASMKGHPSGINLNHIGRESASITAYLNNEITRQEREMNPYHKDFYKNNIVKLAFGNLTFIVGGLLILAFVLIFY